MPSPKTKPSTARQGFYPTGRVVVLPLSTVQTLLPWPVDGAITGLSAISESQGALVTVVVVNGGLAVAGGTVGLLNSGQNQAAEVVDGAANAVTVRDQSGGGIMVSIQNTDAAVTAVVQARVDYLSDQ